MWIVWLIIGMVIGANLSLVLYACIIAGKENDKRCE